MSMHKQIKRKTYRSFYSICLGLAALPLAFTTLAAAEPVRKERGEDMVVTASRSETSREETTKSVSVVGSEDRDEQQQYFLPKLLDSQPGVFLRSLGGLGQWSNISIRGAGPQYTQYQYNGMPLRDAADTQTTLQYFIEDMFSAGNLDRIEVLKGTNSVLYGSQAMGGVINVIPQRWQSGLKAEWRSEIGPNSTYIGNARLAYGTERYYIDINPTYLTTDGEKYGGAHGYSYDNRGGTFAAGFKPTEATALELNVLFSDSDLTLGETPSLDAAGKLIKNQASADKSRESQLSQIGLSWEHEVSSLWDYSLKGSRSDTQRHYFWTKTPGDQSDYDGNITYLEMQHNLHTTDWLTLNLGASCEDSNYDGREPRNKYAGDYTPVIFDESWHASDLFAQTQFVFLDRSLFVNLGGRFNNHEKFDDKTVWEASAAYLIKETGTKLHTQVATGYRTPGLYEIYGGYLANGQLVTIGNPELVPEESTSYEIGLEQSALDGKLQAGISYFYTSFDDMITFDGIDNRYINASEGKNSGIETFLRIQPLDELRLDLAYTYIDSEYKNDKDQWTRKEYLPRNKVNLTLTAYPLEKLSMALSLKWQDEKIVPLYDANFTAVRWQEKSITTVDLAATYKALNNLELFARIDNLFDKDYTESAYCMPGTTVYGGMKLHY
jgi:vitamin B12 transporter